MTVSTQAPMPLATINVAVSRGEHSRVLVCVRDTLRSRSGSLAKRCDASGGTRPTRTTCSHLRSFSAAQMLVIVQCSGPATFLRRIVTISTRIPMLKSDQPGGRRASRLASSAPRAHLRPRRAPSRRPSPLWQSHATRRSASEGRCGAPSGCDTTSSSVTPRLPLIGTCGAAHGARAGYRARGSNRGAR